MPDPQPLRTEIAKVLDCNLDESGKPHYKPIDIVTMRGSERGPISWFDKLVDGGLRVPPATQGDPHSLSILLTGPPGTGKSTLALEMCYRLARRETSLRTLYVTSEAPVEWVLERGHSFRWKDAGVRLRPFPEESREDGGVEILQADQLDSLLAKSAPSAVRTLLEKIKRFVEGRDYDAVPPRSGQVPGTFDIVVLDSLNTVDVTARPEVFTRYKVLASGASAPKIVIFILDSGPAGAPSESWEFACDVVIQLGREQTGDYLRRTFEIVKARYQYHALGKHQVKIYEAPEDQRRPDEDDDHHEARIRRAFPHVEEGGFFVFPSIHYALSVYKHRPALRDPANDSSSVQTPLAGLNTLLKGAGLPKGRCTALLGMRGGHKSHLGYLHLLSQIVPTGNRDRERGLIVSLRDDETSTESTMQKILDEHWPGSGVTPARLERDGLLEILYYAPGYITPEEFFHRLQVSVHRLKGGDSTRSVTLLFNSLDQLSSRFPLCAGEKIFVPGVVQMLSAERITSIFVAAQETPQLAEYHGLESMAEAILSFARRTVSRKTYVEQIRAAPKELGLPRPTPAIERFLPSRIKSVVIEVVRYAGGQAAGARAILELIDTQHPLATLFGGKQGLYCIPLRKEAKEWD